MIDRAEKIKFLAKKSRRAERLSGAITRPELKTGQVYISGRPGTQRHKKMFHVVWCSAINGLWLSGSQNLKIVSKQEAIKEGREPCVLCQTQLGTNSIVPSG